MREHQGIDPQYMSWTLDMAQASAIVANFCDHREHIEPSDPREVQDAAQTMGDIAQEIAAYENIDIKHAYAMRIGEIERRNVLHAMHLLDGEALVLQAQTWRGLQQVQAAHNGVYHPDVAGLKRIDQLRHYSFHTAKLTGALAAVAKAGVTEGFLEKRLPDIAIFRVLIATAIHDILPDTPISS